MARKLAILALVALSAALSLLTGRSTVASEIQAAAARPGSLDPTFGASGKVITDFEAGSYDVGFAVAVQRDGRIVVAGETQSSKGRTMAVVRYRANGALDPTFDGDGKVRSDFAFTSSAVVLQPDQKIVVAGTTRSGGDLGDDFALLRYNVDGSPDTSLGGNGTVATDFGSKYDWPVGIALQPDGRIVLVGFTGRYFQRDVALARYNRDGTLDGSFDGDGKIVSDVGRVDDPGAVAVQPDSRIVVGGSTFKEGNDYSAFLLRYLPDGRLDPAFDGDGRVVVQKTLDSIDDVALQQDGKVVTTGRPNSGWGCQTGCFSVVRFKSNGSWDGGFGDGGVGVALASFQGHAAGGAVTIQPDGKIVVGGSVWPKSGSSGNFALARFLPDGSLDSGFGSGGTVETDLAPGDDWGVDVGIAADGKIVLSGASRPTSDGPFDFAVVRYLGDPQCRVPSVRGQKLPVAKAAIRKANCSLGTVKRKASKKVKRNRVISQSPKAKTTLPNLGKVNVVVSRGRR